VFLCATASQSSSALDPRRRRDLARTKFTSQERTSALDIPQQVIARIGLRPFVRIGAIDALGEIAPHAEIDGHVDHPGTPAGKGLFERAIFTDNRISRLDLQAFDKYVRERGQVFADDIDIWLASREQPGPGDTDPVHTGIGIYHYVVNDEDEREFGQTENMEGTKNAH